MVSPPQAVEAFRPAAHDPMESIPHLAFERVQALLKSVANPPKLLNSLAHLRQPLLRQRKLHGVRQFGHVAHALLDLVNFRQQPARVLPLALPRLLQDPLVEGEDRRGPGELPRHREVRVKAPVLAGDGGDERPHHEVQDRAHREDRHRKAARGDDVVALRRREVVPDCLELARGGPRAGYAPGKRSEVAAGAVLVVVVLSGSVAAERPVPVSGGGGRGSAGVLVVEHEDGEIGERLLRSAELALAEQPAVAFSAGVKGADHDLELLLPQADLVDAVADGVAEIERLDAAIEEVGDQTVERGSGDGDPTGGDDGSEILLGGEEGVEEPSDPGEG